MFNGRTFASVFKSAQHLKIVEWRVICDGRAPPNAQKRAPRSRAYRPSLPVRGVSSMSRSVPQLLVLCAAVLLGVICVDVSFDPEDDEALTLALSSGARSLRLTGPSTPRQPAPINRAIFDGERWLSRPPPRWISLVDRYSATALRIIDWSSSTRAPPPSLLPL